MSGTVAQHYDQALQHDEIIQRLKAAYPEGPNLFQLAPVDQLHIGGINASRKLLQRLEATNSKRVLDIGAGLGGLMRLAHSSLGITLVGLDITHAFNRINRSLSALFDASHQPPLITGDAHRLPFADSSFDAVLFQHSLLNIPDSAQALREVLRVLRPGGSLLMHEVLRGGNSEAMRYPVPWARSADLSHLAAENQLQQLLSSTGFKEVTLEDWSEEALAWRQRQSSKEQSNTTDSAPAPVSPALILGPEFAAMGANVMKNLESDAIRVVEVTARKPLQEGIIG